MPDKLALIILAAGRGSRFAKLGIHQPKPLIHIEERPFFWWATESVRRATDLRQMVFVVLQEHIDQFSIDQKIKGYYPDATVVAIPDVTSGAAETAKIGIEALQAPGAVAINDCDHAFISHGFPEMLKALQGEMAGALMCFRSADPAYSYLKFNLENEIVGTVEKQVASLFAIAGCYLLANAEQFGDIYKNYQQTCPYSELFLSGIFNLLIQNGSKIGMLELERHCSFGTPEEQAGITRELFSPFLSWK
jgi:dTDP-glucose pyrophosphorylase